MTRKLYLIGDISTEMYIDFTKKLDELTAKSKKPIEIELSSGGGDEDIAFAIYGKMKAAGVKFHITAFGMVQSAAILIFAAGAVRLTDAQTIFMVHESAVEINGETSAVRREAQRLDNSEYQFYSIIANRTRLKLSHWMSMARATTYFNAQKAMSYGLANGVIGNEQE